MWVLFELGLVFGKFVQAEGIDETTGVETGKQS